MRKRVRDVLAVNPFPSLCTLQQHFPQTQTHTEDPSPADVCQAAWVWVWVWVWAHTHGSMNQKKTVSVPAQTTRLQVLVAHQPVHQEAGVGVVSLGNGMHARQSHHTQVGARFGARVARCTYPRVTSCQNDVLRTHPACTSARTHPLRTWHVRLKARAPTDSQNYSEPSPATHRRTWVRTTPSRHLHTKEPDEDTQ